MPCVPQKSLTIESGVMGATLTCLLRPLAGMPSAGLGLGPGAFGCLLSTNDSPAIPILPSVCMALHTLSTSPKLSRVGFTFWGPVSSISAASSGLIPVGSRVRISRIILHFVYRPHSLSCVFSWAHGIFFLGLL